MSKIISYYLPQYHPIPENDNWYGKGFTEWTNVAKAKSLFCGHYEPHIPADLGFYDLRLIDTVIEQTKLAKEYGIDSFCYWHYWFGNGKVLLEKPFNNLVKNKDINFSFCLAWDNSTWTKHWWTSKGKDEIIVEQKYGGVKDYTDHFYSLLEAFKDPRYTKIDDKLFFAFNKPLNFIDIKLFMKTWNDLAKKENLPGFYFVARDWMLDNKEKLLKMGFDAVIDNSCLAIHRKSNFLAKCIMYIKREIFHLPTVFKYKDAINYCLNDDDFEENVIPQILPNWDPSPRNGRKSIILKDSNPKYFEILLRRAINCISKKNKENQILIVASWNEWGEGNHLEPDLKYGRGYLDVIKKVRKELNF